jgi:hypothetical protein
MKRGIVLLVLVIPLFLLMFVSAAGESCIITDRASCSGTIVMGLSSSSNAHGQLASEGTYGSVLCCNFAGGLTCDGSNKILGLSSATNAHAEIPTGTAYTNDVCYADLACISTTSSCDANFPLSMVSLSGNSNSHIGGIDILGTNICCTSESLLGKRVYWANSAGTLITQINASIGDTAIKLTLENSELTQGTVVTFEIWEDDLLIDDFIRNITAAVDANGKAVASWVPTQEDMDKTADYSGFYFTASGKESADLTISFVQDLNCNQVAICGDYSKNNFCNSDADLCNVAADSVPSTVDCDDPLIDCSCSWNTNNNKCDSLFILHSAGSPPPVAGTCTFASSTGDNCDDGLLSYSWTASWSGTAEDKPESCVDGSKTLECPAQIQLPFFGFYNFIIAASLIIGIYLLLVLRRRDLIKFIK